MQQNFSQDLQLIMHQNNNDLENPNCFLQPVVFLGGVSGKDVPFHKVPACSVFQELRSLAAQLCGASTTCPSFGSSVNESVLFCHRNLILMCSNNRTCAIKVCLAGIAVFSFFTLAPFEARELSCLSPCAEPLAVPGVNCRGSYFLKLVYIKISFCQTVASQVHNIKSCL